MNHWLHVFGCGAALLVGVVLWRDQIPSADTAFQMATGKHTVNSRLDEFGYAARSRFRADFERAGISMEEIGDYEWAWLAFKDEKRLEIFVRRSNSSWKWVKSYPIVRASGEIGPKLREGDGQVPEGFYEIESFNPNSAFHVSLRVSYPSAQDREIAARENRENLGGDIMIHGGAASIGCLAMGDEVAEELFVLAADAGRENVKLVFCPLDFRSRQAPADAKRPQWLQTRYAQLRDWVRELPASS